MSHNKECGKDAGHPSPGKDPGREVDDTEKEALKAEDTLNIEEDGFHGWADERAEERAIDRGQEQLLVDIEPVENVDRS